MASPGGSSSGGVSATTAGSRIKRATFRRLADHAVQFLQVERLEQVVVRPLPHRLDGRIGRPDHGDKDDRDAGVDLAELPQDVQAGLVGQAQVEENDVRPGVGDAFRPSAPVLGDLDPVCGGGEHVAHLVREQVRVVIDQEQVWPWDASPGTMVRSWNASVIVRIRHEAVSSMTHSDNRPNRDISDYLDLALRLANLFPAVVDFETGEIDGPDLWDEVVGNPPGTTPPRLAAWEAAIHPDDRPARDASWADCLAGRAPLHQAEYRVRRHDGHWVWIKVCREGRRTGLRGSAAAAGCGGPKHRRPPAGRAGAAGARAAARLAHGAPSGAGLPGPGRRSLDRPVRQQGHRRPDRLPGRRVHFPPAQLRRHHVARGPAGDPRGRLHRPAGAEDVRGRAPHPAQGRLGPVDLGARPWSVRPGRLPPLHRGLEPGHDPPKAGRGGAAPGQGGGGGGEPSQGRVPGQRQP